MKEFVYDYTEGMVRGLRPLSGNNFLNLSLIRCDGVYPQPAGTLVSPTLPLRFNLDFLGCTFPYPQVFVTSNLLIICTETQIWESSLDFISGYLTEEEGDRLEDDLGQLLTYQEGIYLKLQQLTPGLLWSLVDFQSFVWLSNGEVNVTRNTQTGEYSISTELPRAAHIAQTESQVIVSSANSRLPMRNISADGYTCFESELSSAQSIGGTFSAS